MTTREIIPENAAELDSGTVMFLTGDFIDAFKAAGPDARCRMIQDEPLHIDKASPYARAIIAGMVEWLCNHYGLERCKPDWIMRNQYYLDDPYFALNAKGDLRFLLFVQSPPELRTRNIFTTENIFSRV